MREEGDAASPDAVVATVVLAPDSLSTLSPDRERYNCDRVDSLSTLPPIAMELLLLLLVLRNVQLWMALR